MNVSKEYLKMALKLIVLLAVICNFVVASQEHLTDADFSWRRELQEQNETGGSCTQNEERTGIMCTGIPLYETTIGDKPLLVALDLNTTYEMDSESFVSHAMVWVTFWRLEHESFADFEFNSSTPNGTVIASGQKRINGVPVPTGNNRVPSIPASILADYNVTLYWNGEDDPACANDASNASGQWQCDSGWFAGNLGLFGTAARTFNTFRLISRLDEPDAVHVTAPFVFSVNDTTFCSNIEENIVYDKNMTVRTSMCPLRSGGPCRTLDIPLNSTGWDRMMTVDDQCFELGSGGSDEYEKL
jgi:hypothetical protein